VKLTSTAPFSVGDPRCSSRQSLKPDHHLLYLNRRQSKAASDLSHEHDGLPARPPPTIAGAESKLSPAPSATFSSPLAKLFGKPAAVPGKKEVRGSAGRGGDEGKEVKGGAGEESVEDLKRELGVVRESQLRMEELLNKLLSAGGGD
jgi:hypothetical protein